jgi:hypothetical protein
MLVAYLLWAIVSVASSFLIWTGWGTRAAGWWLGGCLAILFGLHFW